MTLEQTPTLAAARSGRIIALVALLVVLGLLAWRLSDVLVLMFGAVIVAVALQAIAAPLERILRVKRQSAVAAAVVLTLAVLVLGSWLAGDRLLAQTEDLRQRLPEAMAALVAWARGHSLGVAALQVWEGINAEDMPWARVANAATRTLGAIGSIGLVLVLGVYLAADPQLYRRGLVRLVPPAWRARVDGALIASAQALSRWLLGQGISMLFVGSTTTIGLAVLGIPLAVTIGVIAGVLAFVPFFGPIASGILAVLLAFMQGPQQALYAAGLCIAIQQVEGNLLMPFVQRWAVDLPAVLGISAAVIFGLMFGLPGVILATPLMVVLIVLIEKLYVEAVLEAEPPTCRLGAPMEDGKGGGE
jgi:predicted PurR-regulated permease PerM